MATGSLGQGLPIAVGDRARRQGARPAAVPRLGALRRQRDGRGLDLGGLRARRPRQARQPDRDHRHQPARPARRDDARLGPRRPTLRRAEAFGWHAIEIDGHDVDAIDAAYAEALGVEGRPTVIVARTRQGQGRERGRGQGRLARQAARRSRGGGRRAGRRARPARRRCATASRPSRTRSTPAPLELPRYELGDEVATRKAYGDALRGRRGARTARGRARRRGDQLDPRRDLQGRPTPSASSRCSSPSSRWSPPRSGMQVRGWKPFASTFAAFLTRAYDFIRMAAVSRATIALSGSHAGVSIGEDGPSQMALEDLAMMRAVRGSTVLYPCDAQPDRAARRGDGRARGHLVHAHDARRDAGRSTGPTRSSRSAAAGSLRSSDEDEVTIVGGRHHGPRGARGGRRARGRRASRRGSSTATRVKPIDADGLREAAAATGARRDRRGPLARGRPRRGRALGARRAGRHPRVERLAVSGMPGSGKPAELLAAAGIDRRAHRRRGAAAGPRPRATVELETPTGKDGNHGHISTAPALGARAERLDRLPLARHAPLGAARAARWRRTPSSASPRTRPSSRRRSPPGTPTTSSSAPSSRTSATRRSSSCASPSRTSRTPATSCAASGTTAAASDGYVSIEVDPTLAYDTDGDDRRGGAPARARRPPERCSSRSRRPSRACRRSRR